jgi:DNA-binding NtrC family response regulator
MADVLVVEDKESLRAVLRKTLESRGFTVEESGDAYDARRRLQSSRFLVVLTDLKLPAGSGLEVLEAAIEADPQTPVVVMTAFGTVDEAVRAMKAGAADFLTKPVDTDHLMLLLERAIERRRLLIEYVVLKEDYQRRFGLPKLLGEDPVLKETTLALQRAAGSDATVLLLGESGTGKELMARSLHQLSARAKAPFVAINCAAIPEGLLENELFGHEKGAFTGATGRKVGKAELAHHGTLFLDEIGDLPLSLQGKILRLVQEKQFERVGGVQTLTVDVRVVAATNRDLREAVAGKEFREDLFFRLSVLPVEIPPLRRRRGDILILAEAFLERYAREMGRRGAHLGEGTREALVAHSWPGNVRELQNCLERAVILADGPEIRPEHLRLGEAQDGPTLADVIDLSGTLADVTRRAVARAEEDAVRRALQESGGNRRAAAERLGISLSTLTRRLKAQEEAAAPGEGGEPAEGDPE